MYVCRKEKDIAPYLCFDGVYPPFDIMKRWKQIKNGIDNLNVNIILKKWSEFDKKNVLLSLNDFWRSYAVNFTSLETLQRLDPLTEVESSFLSFMPSKISSSHPLPDPNEKGSHLTYLTSANILQPLLSSQVTLVRLKSATKSELVTKWAISRAPYMHR